MTAATTLVTSQELRVKFHWNVIDRRFVVAHLADGLTLIQALTSFLVQ